MTSFIVDPIGVSHVIDNFTLTFKEIVKEMDLDPNLCVVISEGDQISLNSKPDYNLTYYVEIDPNAMEIKRLLEEYKNFAPQVAALWVTKNEHKEIITDLLRCGFKPYVKNDTLYWTKMTAQNFYDGHKSVFYYYANKHFDKTNPGTIHYLIDLDYHNQN